MKTSGSRERHGTILALAIPNILSNLSVPLVGVVDTALMGRLESEHFIGAIAIGGIIFNFVYWGFGFLRMATTGLVAQALGRGDEEEVQNLFIRIAVIALLGSVSVILLQLPVEFLSFWLIDASAPVEAAAREYFRVRIWAAPATIFLYGIHGWYLGLQNARYPMVLTIVVNVANVLLSWWFVFQVGMTADGVALGTVVAQYLGLLLGLLMVVRDQRNPFRSVRWDAVVNLARLQELLSVGGDITIRTLCLVFAFSFFTAKSGELGDTVLAVNALLLQLFNVMAYGVDGFAFATESLVGKLVGERKYREMRKMLKLLFLWSGAIAGLCSLSFLFAEQPILRIFTDQQQLIDQALIYMPWMAIMPLIAFVCFVWDGAFLGATASAPMRNNMLLSTFGIFLPAYYLLVGPFGNHGLWLAFTIFMLGRSIGLSVLAPTYLLKRRDRAIT